MDFFLLFDKLEKRSGRKAGFCFGLSEIREILAERKSRELMSKCIILNLLLLFLVLMIALENYKTWTQPIGFETPPQPPRGKIKI
jgi:hypothetical protein